MKKLLTLSVLILGWSKLTFCEVESVHATGTTADTSRPVAEEKADGIVFECPAPVLSAIKKRMSSYLSDMGFNESLYEIRESKDSSKPWLSFRLRSTSTSTIDLRERPELNIKEEMWLPPTDTSGTRRSIPSKKEIVAGLLTRGRKHDFSGDACSFDHLIDHISMRQDTAKAAASGHMTFDADKLNPNLWEGRFGLKPGVKATDAVGDIFEGSFEYDLGCYRACNAISVQGVMAHFKKSKEGKDFINKIAGNFPLNDPDEKYFSSHDNVPWNNFIPGDWGYFRNNDLKSRAIPGNEGSNVIYVGGGKFANYYKPISGKRLTIDEKIDYVMSWSLEPEFGDNAPDEWEKRRDRIMVPGIMDSLRQDPWKSNEEYPRRGMLSDGRSMPKHFKETVSKDAEYKKLLDEATRRPN